MAETAKTVRVQLSYPSERASEPILYRLVVDHGLVPNIRRGRFDASAGGIMLVELTGDSGDVDRGLRWLEEIGVSVSVPGVDSTPEWAV